MQKCVIGSVDSPNGPLPQVSAGLRVADHLGAVKVRWGIGRMSYAVEPGLYAVGSPGPDSPVLVSANYKLSFDVLRSQLAGLDAWILVLDTHGINVWCAAGKGTFGTDELVRQIEGVRLSQVVRHRKVIVPQLGAPGVAGFKVKKASGFKVVWGPIRARDLPAFIANGFEARPEMRRKDFPFAERFALVPMELVPAFKPLFLIVPLVLLAGGLAGVAGSSSFSVGVLEHGLGAAWTLLAAVVAGAVLTPLLLPWLPGRAFSLKGAWAGAVVCGATVFSQFGFGIWPDRLESLGWWLIGTAVSAFVAMNFTGASTYTSLSGVRREMRLAIPVQVSAAVLGFGLWITGCWIA